MKKIWGISQMLPAVVWGVRKRKVLPRDIVSAFQPHLIEPTQDGNNLRKDWFLETPSLERRSNSYS